jgi:hypothetical protein
MPELSENEIAELACTYASLVLHDENIPITVRIATLEEIYRED